jgi:hypothetical protein
MPQGAREGGAGGRMPQGVREGGAAYILNVSLFLYFF